MNAKRILFVALSVILCCSSVCAQKNEKGIDYYRAELYDAAKLYFKQQTGLTATEQAENYYYLGQSYAATAQLDSAAYYYDKAVTSDPEYPYGYIGQGMLELNKKTKNGADAANELFKKAIGFSKKDPAIHTAVAEAYINMKMYDQAEEVLDRARKVKKDFSGIYVAEGDMLMSKGDVGGAAAKYENAILFNKNDKVAYLKEARVYKGINPSLSLDLLNRLIEVDPGYVPAYAELGDIYYTGIDKKPNYNKAIEAYEKIMKIPGVPIAQEARYAQLLFFTDRNIDAVAQIREVLEKDPSNYVMKRLQAYNNFKLENYTLGLEQMSTFMRETKPENLISLDYTYFGRLLMKNKQMEPAVENLVKAYSMDTTKHELLKEISDAYQGVGNYPESVAYAQKFLNANPESVTIDYFNFGTTCYRAAANMIAKDATASSEQLVQDSLQRDKYIALAEEAYNTVIERMPDKYLGYYWLGKTMIIKDIVHHKGVGGLANSYYEKALGIMLSSNENGKLNREIIDIYTYFGAYYVALEDSKTSKEYWNKILEIDPENTKAKEVLRLFDQQR